MGGRLPLFASVWAVVLGLGVSNGAVAASRLVLLPAENWTDERTAPGVVEELIAQGLARMGWSIVRGAALEESLRSRRLRSFDSLTEAARRDLLREFEAEALLHSVVQTWRAGSNAQVAISCRLVDALGRTLWSEASSLTSDQTADAIDLRRAREPREVAALAVKRLLDGGPQPGRPSAETSRSAPWSRGAKPAVFRSGSFHQEATSVAALLPFENRSLDRGAPRIAADATARGLRRAGYQLVESAELRRALVEAGIPSMRRLDAQRLQSLSRALGTRWFLRGTIWQWRDGSPSSAAVVPELELELELFEASSGAMLWSLRHRRSGLEYERMFLRGASVTASELVENLLAEMLEELEETAPTVQTGAGFSRPAE